GLCGVSLAIGPNDACYVPLTHEHPPMAGAGGLDFGGEAAQRAPLNQIAKAEALSSLKRILENPAALKVVQNGRYGLAVRARTGIRAGAMCGPLLIRGVLGGDLQGRGMEELARLHLGPEPIPFKSVPGTGKAQESFKHGELRRATCYAAEDADVTL